MIESDLVDVMIILPGQLFFSTPIPACLWFLSKNKKTRKGQVLFIDARKLASMISRSQAELNNNEVEKIAKTISTWRGEGGEYEDVAGFCRSVPLAEIATHGYVLTPGRYVGAKEVESDGESFEVRMVELKSLLSQQIAEGAELDRQIAKNLLGLGYEI